MLQPNEYFEPLPAEDRDSEFIAMESKSFARNVWESFSADRLALIGLILLAVIILAAVIGPMLSPYPYDGMDAMNRNLGRRSAQAPSAALRLFFQLQVRLQPQTYR